MAEPAKDLRTVKPAERKAFKYPSEDETYVRRLGSALLAHWNEVPEDLRLKIVSEAAVVWDREYNVPQLTQKLENFVRRYPGRVR